MAKIIFSFKIRRFFECFVKAKGTKTVNKFVFLI